MYKTITDDEVDYIVERDRAEAWERRELESQIAQAHPDWDYDQIVEEADRMEGF
jgi:hypothetical protein